MTQDSLKSLKTVFGHLNSSNPVVTLCNFKSITKKSIKIYYLLKIIYFNVTCAIQVTWFAVTDIYTGLPLIQGTQRIFQL